MVHIKRLAVPRTWPIARKETVFVAKQLPGKRLEHSLPLSLVLKLLGYAKTTKDAKFILNSGKVKVNGKVVKEYRYPIGLFDVISLEDLNKHFRLIFKGKKLFLNDVKAEEAKYTLSKIVNKTTLKRNKIQVNLHDGRNFLYGSGKGGKEAKKEYNIGDSIVFNMHENKIENSFKLEQGNVAYLVGGKHSGEIGKIKSIEGNKIKLFLQQADESGKEILASKENIIVVGKDKPIISIKIN